MPLLLPLSSFMKSRIETLTPLIGMVIICVTIYACVRELCRCEAAVAGMKYGLIGRGEVKK